MAAESMWPGMFQAEAGRGNTPSVRSTRDATSDTVASYAISNEQGARKKVLDKRQQTAVNRGKFNKLKIGRVLYVSPLYQHWFVFLRPFGCAHFLALSGGNCCGAGQHQSGDRGAS